MRKKRPTTISQIAQIESIQVPEIGSVKSMSSLKRSMSRKMSKLRKQLHQAKREYESLRYPDDLAADVMGQLHPPVANSSHWMRIFAIAAGLLLAASAVFVAINRPSDKNIAQHDPESAVVDPTVNVAVDPKMPANPNDITPEANPDQVATNQTIDGSDPDESTSGESTTEEYVALSPAFLASAEQTSMSIVRV